jgi:hypothetical protein
LNVKIRKSAKLKLSIMLCAAVTINGISLLSGGCVFAQTSSISSSTLSISSVSNSTASSTVSAVPDASPSAATNPISTNATATIGTTSAAGQEKSSVNPAALDNRTDDYCKSGEIYKKGVGLSGDELHLVNQGRFAELANKLSPELHNQEGASGPSCRKAAWLAFAYLYLQKCDDLKKLLQSGKEANANDLAKKGIGLNGDELHTVAHAPIPDNRPTLCAINSTLVNAFSLLCEKKTDDAEHMLQYGIPAAAMNDAFVNYAFATLAGPHWLASRASHKWQ